MTIFGALEECRNRPLPDQTDTRNRKSRSRRHPIDRNSTLYREPLADARDHAIAGENYYYASRNPPYWRRIEGSVPELFLRLSVIQKLERVNARLREEGLELFLFDAWRPKAVQAYFHDVWLPAELQRRDPTLSGAALRCEVEKYWAAPSSDAASPAPHETGGAVDLTLRFTGGDPLWMGSLFDDATGLAHRDRFENATMAWSFSDDEARANRRLLHWVMADEEFQGHPNEWWHFSYGDQLWAVLSGAPQALYGIASP